ncbi:hypothetical protein MVES1_003395 [Malassezia vespertilionis]|uniref:Transmembrane protein n=1 Tax=Malassezia vespertilionis TaxID=2020962 RepID=A0A2N1J781_9BASI|nr:uncharacterized protein MVES1_003395 [Malassezia vespertilionis]PKI82417.1 hypothetical protein MVES_003635 [Malassezia vespertilionis]WFD08026.1 hypothetical protein MVES1_003395 [Malassezia vespertilionis]
MALGRGASDAPRDAARQDAHKDATAARTRFILTLSTVAFVTGAAGTLFYCMRRKPGTPNVHAVTGDARAMAHAAASEEQAPVKTPLALFREMHAGAWRFLSPRAPAMHAKAPASAVRAVPAKRTTIQAAPVGLAKLKATPATPPVTTVMAAAPHAAPTSYSIGVLAPTPERTPHEPRDQTSDGPLLALGAFSLATSIVGASALGAVLWVRYYFEISSVDEFVDRMRAALSQWRLHTYVQYYMPSFSEEDTAPHAMDMRLAPEELHARIADTQDPAEFLRLMRVQLDQEYAAHEEARAARLAARAQSKKLASVP